MQIACLSLLPVVVYPYMKRVTYWPQAVLGLTFNWGALLGFPALANTFMPAVSIPLYIAGIAWTLIYDTIYAHQDKYDDLKIGVYSTALRFGPRTPYWLCAFSTVAVAALDVAGFANMQSWLYFTLLNGVAFPALLHMSLFTDFNNPKECSKIFMRNTYWGAFIWLVLIIETLTSLVATEFSQSETQTSSEKAKEKF